MYYVMERAQERHRLSDRLIRAISHWQLSSDMDDDIERLIEAGADVNRIHGTLLPLHCACMVGDAEILRLLLEKGAKVNAVDGYERTAIHYAAERDETCLRILLQHDAVLDQGDGNQDTALHWASYKNNVACVRLLLRHGANVNAVDYNNDTPISWAARKGNLEVIKILLDYNADIEIRNTYGNTPLQRSAAIQASGLNTEQDNGCLELLIKASGRFDLLTDQGLPVPVIARDNRINEMLRPMCSQARPLLDLCRRQIRNSLGRAYLPNVVPSLPLPSRLQDFLLLRDGKEMILGSLQNEDSGGYSGVSVERGRARSSRPINRDDIRPGRRDRSDSTDSTDRGSRGCSHGESGTSSLERDEGGGSQRGSGYPSIGQTIPGIGGDSVRESACGSVSQTADNNMAGDIQTEETSGIENLVDEDSNEDSTPAPSMSCDSGIRLAAAQAQTMSSGDESMKLGATSALPSFSALGSGHNAGNPATIRGPSSGAPDAT